jgi:hypothetical protein
MAIPIKNEIICQMCGVYKVEKYLFIGMRVKNKNVI